MDRTYDAVIYGASGFTGAYIVRALASSKSAAGKKIAVAGRNESKLRKTLLDVSDDIGVNVRDWPILIADSSDVNSLAAMARQATVIINAVGPYRLYGEEVVRAAVENGAHHVDISGEPTFLESMQLKYSELAREKGVYVVGACGFDSIPCDMGVHFLKRNFDGSLGYAETYFVGLPGPSGYAINSGTYETLMLAIANKARDGLGKLRRAIMPDKLKTAKSPKRNLLFSVDEPSLEGRALPFAGSDKSVVKRSQYYDFHANKKIPVAVETYFTVSSLFSGVLLMAWMAVMAILCQFKPTLRFVINNPDLMSFGKFRKAGPTKQQIKEMKFSYYVFGRGWEGEVEDVPETEPTKIAAAVCRGPDPGYVATAGCVAASALTILNDKANLPKNGGVYTTASAFGNSRLIEILKEFGITFELLYGGKK